jgi:hypothetical protein
VNVLQNQVSERTGNWYTRFLTCFECVAFNVQANGHRRWQMRIPQPGARRNIGSSFDQLWNALSVHGRTQLYDEYLATPFGTTGWWFKVQTHHVGLRAQRNAPLLPLDLGAGSSVDHLCGNKGCHRPEHLILAPTHITNIARIGCSGVLLNVQDGNIVGETPCRHAIGTTLQERIQTGCRRVHIVPIAFETGAVVTHNWQAEATMMVQEQLLFE